MVVPPGPGPLDNPLKGFASYCDAGTPLNCPVTMAYEGASFKQLEPEEGHFTFDEWEEDSWDKAPAAGKRVVLRIFMDYPHEAIAVPQWLVDKGVKMTHYDEFGGGYSPHYENRTLVQAILDFIKAFGNRYDHDDRVAYIEVGFLGHWGEWHTYPRDELFASPRVQTEVIQALRNSFPDKYLLARNAEYPSCQLPWLGFHDDMIPQDTLGTENWEFLPAIVKGGVANNWKTAPLGGEMVPQAARQYLGKDWPLLQDAVTKAHFTWIGPYSPAMLRNPTDEERARIETLIRMLGYVFQLKEASMPASINAGNPFSLSITGSNDGVAPLYAKWTPTFAFLDSSGKVVFRVACMGDPRTWLPGSFSVRASTTISKPGHYDVGFGLVNPATQQAEVKFANNTRKTHGFAIVGSLTVNNASK
jgi:hypothetical protein